MRAYHPKVLETTILYTISRYQQITKKNISMEGLCNILVAFDYEVLCKIGMPSIEIFNELQLGKGPFLQVKMLPEDVKVLKDGTLSFKKAHIDLEYLSEFELELLNKVIEHYIKNGLTSQQENIVMYLISYF